MGVVLGLGVGAGLLLILSGLPDRSPAKPRRDRSLPSPGLLMRCVGAGAAAGLLGLGVTAVPVLGLLAGIVGAGVPLLWQARSRARRLREHRSAWPDAIDAMVGGLRAGMPLGETLAALAETGPDPLRPHFAAFAVQWRCGASFDQAVTALAVDADDPVADRIVVSLRLAMRSGSAQTGAALTTLGDFLRADARMRAEIEARQSWTVNAARVAVAAPWLVVALLSTRPESVAAYASPTGSLLLLGAAVACVVAYLTMRRIARLPSLTRLEVHR